MALEKIIWHPCGCAINHFLFRWSALALRPPATLWQPYRLHPLASARGSARDRLNEASAGRAIVSNRRAL